MSFKTNLVNFAEKIKSGIEDAAGDAVKLASFLSTNATEINGLASLAGASGSKVTATATNTLNTVVTAVQAAGDAASANGLSVSFDAAAIADVKAVIAALEKI
jgi:hypothetical protein